MQTTTFEVAADMQASYPECIKESKSTNRAQALLWLLIAAVLFGIYSQLPDKGSPLSLVQITLIAVCAVMAVYKFFCENSKLIYVPTGGVIKKQTYNFNIALQAELLHCLEEGNTARLKAFKNDDAGGLMVELLESEDHLFIAARLLKYEPHGYVAKSGWKTMKR